MSAFGPKRTSLVALHMSAFDPKRTWRLFKCLKWRDTISSILRLGASNEATRLHRVSRWLDSHMAVCCMGAAASTRAAHRRAHDWECQVVMLWTAPPPGTRVPWIWGLLGLPRSGGATHANGHDNRFGHCEVSFSGTRH